MMPKSNTVVVDGSISTAPIIIESLSANLLVLISGSR